MTNYGFLHRRLRPFSIHLLLAIAISLCLTLCVNAQNIGQDLVMTQENQAANNASGVIDAIVKDIQGMQIFLEGGIVIDASNASIISVGGAYNIPITAIKPGMTIRLSLVPPDDPSSPFVANFIRIRLEDEMILSGVIQAADLENGFFTLMNQKIFLDHNTLSPGGFKRKKLAPGLPISVVVRHNGSGLLATWLLPHVPLPAIFP
jgi:hypothetical protein